jgi:hypothetical protein
MSAGAAKVMRQRSWSDRWLNTLLVGTEEPDEGNLLVRVSGGGLGNQSFYPEPDHRKTLNKKSRRFGRRPVK